MRPIATDRVAWSVCVCSSVCLSVGHTTTVSHCKTDEPIELPFGGTRVGPRNRVLNWVYIGATWRIRLNDPCAAAMRTSVNRERNCVENYNKRHNNFFFLNCNQHFGNFKPQHFPSAFDKIASVYFI